jgi:hypothetical protein
MAYTRVALVSTPTLTLRINLTRTPRHGSHVLIAKTTTREIANSTDLDTEPGARILIQATTIPPGSFYETFIISNEYYGWIEGENRGEEVHLAWRPADWDYTFRKYQALDCVTVVETIAGYAPRPEYPNQLWDHHQRVYEEE